METRNKLGLGLIFAKDKIRYRLPPWDGTIGLTIADYRSRSEIYLRPSTNYCIISDREGLPREHDSHITAAGFPGAI